MMTPARLEEIKHRQRSDLRWCAEVGVPPSSEAMDRRELLAEVDRLRAALADRDAKIELVEAIARALGEEPAP